MSARQPTHAPKGVVDYDFSQFRKWGLWGLAAVVVGLPVFMIPELISIFVVPKQALLFVLAGGLLVVLASDGVRLPRSPWFLASLAALAVFEVVAYLLADDRREAILGAYNTQMGFLTHVAFFVLFIAAMTLIRSEKDLTELLAWGCLPVAVVCLYALSQRAGVDPVDFAASTVDLVPSTLGNRNEVAAFGMLGIAFIPGLMAAAKTLKVGPRWQPYVPAAAFLAGIAVIEQILINSLSRAAVAGGLLALILLAALAAYSGVPRAKLGRLALATAAVLLVGGLLAWPSTSKLLGRVGDTGSDSSDAARTDIWEGSIEVIASDPLFGIGQEGMVAAFERERPGDLGAARFTEVKGTGQEPAVTSPHNIVLEAIVAFGAAGTVALASLFLAAFTLVANHARKERSMTLAFVAAGMAGYGTAIALNPVALANFSVFAVLAGATIGLTIPRREPAGLPVGIRFGAMGVAGAVGVAAVGFAVIAITAERSFAVAQEGGLSLAHVEKARSAADRLPFVENYRRLVPRIEGAYAVGTNDAKLLDATTARQRAFLADFQPLSHDWLWLATLEIQRRDFAAAEAAIVEALKLAPHGPETAAKATSLRADIEKAKQQPAATPTPARGTPAPRPAATPTPAR
ncbi:MAG: O-antigen ligase family protein [Dehalococcoidia bacterium]